MQDTKKALDDLNKAYKDGQIGQDEYNRKSIELKKKIKDLGDATQYTTFTQEELTQGIENLNNMPIDTDEDVAELQRLANAFGVAAQKGLDLARAKIIAAQSNLDQAKIESEQTAK